MGGRQNNKTTGKIVVKLLRNLQNIVSLKQLSEVKYVWFKHGILNTVYEQVFCKYKASYAILLRTALIVYILYLKQICNIYLSSYAIWPIKRRLKAHI